jgi:hypothetical protein
MFTTVPRRRARKCGRHACIAHSRGEHAAGERLQSQLGRDVLDGQGVGGDPAALGVVHEDGRRPEAIHRRSHGGVDL